MRRQITLHCCCALLAVAACRAPAPEEPNPSRKSQSALSIPVVALWDFSEGAGTTSADSSGNGNTLTLKPDAGFTASGHVGSALLLNGSFDTYAETADSASQRTPISEITMEAWIYPNTVSGRQEVIRKGNGAAYDLWLYDNTINISVANLNNSGCTPARTITANAWHHVAAVLTGTRVITYVDGDACTKTVTPTTIQYPAAWPICIGKDCDYGSCFFGGKIDQAAVYSLAASDAEICAQAGRAPGTCAGSNTLAITPQNQTLAAGASLNFTGAGGTGPYTWSLSPNRSGATLTGTAPVTYTAGTVAGVTDRLKLSDSLTQMTSTTISVIPAAANKLAFTVQPTTATAGGSISPSVKVAVQDTYGNVVTTSTASITLAIAVNPGGSTLSGTLVQSAVSGVATFTNLSLNKTGSGYTLRATSGALSLATSATFDIQPASASVLAFSGQPSNTVAGSNISPAVAVAVQDSFGNLVPTSSASITVAIGANPGGGVLSGATVVSAIAGVATFSSLNINKAGSGYTLTASSGALGVGTSTTFNVTPGAANKLAFTVQPTNATAGSNISPAVAITVQDSFSNTVTTSTASVTLTIGTNPSSGTLSGMTVVSAVSGVATFSTLNIDKAGVGYTLSAASGALSGATSNAFNINPGTATKLAFTTQPTHTVAGSNISPAVVVAVQDASGNTVTSSTASITVAIGANPSGGVLSGTTVVSAAGGVASFSTLNLNAAGVGYTLTANSGTLAQATSSVFSILAGPASRLAFTVQPSSTVAGNNISPAVVVVVQDALGNTATSSTASITVAIGTNPGGGVLSGTTTVTAAAGVASFSTLNINKTGTGYTLTAASAPLTGATSGGFNITASSANRLAFTVQPTNAGAGSNLSPAVVVTVQDSLGNTVTASTATITVAIGNNPSGGVLLGTTVVSAAGGLASFSTVAVDKVGVGYTLTAASGSLIGATSAGFNVTPGTANKLAFTTQPTNTVAGSNLSPAVAVTVQDSYGNTVTGSTASITVAIGTNPAGGVLSGTKVVSATGGVASFSTLNINAAGAGYTLTAASSPLSGATSAGFNVTPGTANRLAFTTQPTNTVAGSNINPAVVVTVQDNLGNTVTGSTASITVAIGTNPVGGTLSGTTVVTASGGVASFSTLNINLAGNGYTLAATSGALSQATSNGFNITASSGNKLAFTTQPGNAVAGSNLSPAVVVTVQDSMGNTVTTSTASITLAIGTNPGGGALSGTTVMSAVAGVATFSTLNINKSGMGYTLVATSGALSGATSAGFNITAGVANKLAFTVQPSNAVAGSNLSPAVAVTVQDALGNTVTTSTASITVAIGTNPGGGTLFGTTVVLAAAGVASFSTLNINAAGVGYTLSASSSPLAGATSAGFNVTPGVANKLAFTTQPSNTAAGSTISPAVVVVVQDALGNTVSSSTASLTLAIGTNPNSGTLSGTTVVTAAGGSSSFSTLNINAAGNGYTLVASSGALSQATSNAFNVTASAANKLSFTTQPSNVVAGSNISPAVVVTVQDSLGNTVNSSTASITVAIGTNPGGGTLSGTAVVSAVAGVATFSALSIGKTGVGYTLSATSGALSGATSIGFNVTPGVANKLAFTAQPTNTVAGSNISPAVAVTVQDALGNTVTGSTASITVAIGTNPGGGVLSGTTVVSAAAGVASFSTLNINKSGTGYTLTATSGALSLATSATFNVTAGTANKLSWTVQPSNTVAGNNISPAVVVAVQDNLGNTVSTSTASITVAIGTNPGGGVLSGTTVVAASGGVASFSTLNVNAAGNGYTLVSSSGPLSQATSNAFNVTASAANKLAFTVQPTNTVAGSNLSPAVVVTVQDSLGNTVTGSTASITLAIGSNPGGGVLGGTSVVSAVAGLATFSTLNINKSGVGYTLGATSGGLSGVTSNAFNVVPGVANKLAFTVPPTNTVAGSNISPAVVVAVQDNLGNTVTNSTASITVAIGTNPGGGALSGTTVVTAAAGVASFATLNINATGTAYTLAATSGALSAATSVGFNVTPGAPNKLAFTVQPSDTVAGNTISPAVVVAVQDALGNTVTGSTASITVAIGTNPAGGVLSGTKVVAAAAGVASFATLNINATGTGYTLTAASGALSGGTSVTFNVLVAAANKVVFTTQPTNTVAGSNISPAVVVAVQDSLGNTITSSTASITVAIGANPGGGSLSGTMVVSAVAGVATFSALNINKTGIGYSLTAGSGVLTAATSNAFDVTPGAANKLVFSAQPNNAVAGSNISPAIAVTVQDSLGNTVTGSSAGVTVSIGANPSGGTLSGTTVVSAAGGVASFSTLNINAAGVGYTLTANSGTLTSATSNAFSIAAGGATKLVFTAQPGNTVAGSNISPAVVVTVQDSLGNTVTSSTASITVGLGANPGGGVLSGTTVVAAAGGVASFSTLNVNRTGVGYTLSAASGILAGATSLAFNVTPGTASKLAFTEQPSDVAAGSAINPAVAVTVQDLFGNTVTASAANITVSVGTNPAGGVLSGTRVVPATGGVAFFSGLSLDKSGVGYTLTAASGVLAGAGSASFAVVPGAANKLVFTIQPTDTMAAASVNPAVVVAVKDFWDNTVTSSSASITVSLGNNPAGGTLSGTRVFNATSGIALFSTLSINNAGLGYTLVATSTGLGPATSAGFNITAGSPDRLTFTVQPSSAVAGTSISPAIAVTVQDSVGNTVTSSSAPITLAIGANPGGALLSGTVVVNAASGIATFPSVNIAKVGVGYTLTAASPGFTGSTSASFDIAPGAANRLVFAAQPKNAVAGAALSPPVVVVVQDVLGNTVSSSSVSVTLAIETNPGGGTLGGTTVVNAVAGIASFTSLTVDKTGAGYTLSARSGVLTGATSAPFDIGPGPSARLVFKDQPPQSAIAGISISPSVSVAVQDALGNVVSNSADVVTISIGANPGGGTLSGGTTQVRAAGVVTFPSLVIDKSGTGYNLSATSGSLAGATSSSFDILPGTPAKLAFFTQPSQAFAGSFIAPPIQVVVLDFFGNRVGDGHDSVTLAFVNNAGNGTLSGTKSVDALGGMATFSDISVDKAGVGYTLSASSSLLAGTTSDPFEIKASSLVVAPSSVSLAPKGYVAFSAGSSGVGPYDYSLSVNNSGGSINAATGYYVAGDTGNVTDVVRVADAVGSSVTVTVFVTPAVAISPLTSAVDPLAQLAFSASGGRPPYVFSPAAIQSGGTIKVNGIYTAGPLGHVSDTIQVMDSNSAVSTATVWVNNHAPVASLVASTHADGGALPALPDGGVAVLAVDGGTEVYLSAAASADDDADPLSFTFTQLVPSPTTVLPGSGSLRSFTAPKLGSDTLYQFAVDVTDDPWGGVDRATVDVLVLAAPDLQPQAFVPAPFAAMPGRITLVGGWNDPAPSSRPLTFHWEQTSGLSVTLVDADKDTAWFFATASGARSFDFVVQAGTDKSKAAVTTVTVLNVKPWAKTPSRLVVRVGTDTVVNGARSNDPNGDPLQFRWGVEDPTGSLLLSNKDQKAARISATADGRYEVHLVTNDGQLDSIGASVEVIAIDPAVADHAPVANAGGDRVAELKQVVTLDGQASYDIDGDALSYSWKQVSGSPGQLSGETTATPTFKTTNVGLVGIALTVSDGHNTSAESRINIDVTNQASNRRPEADAGTGQVTTVGSVVELDGQGSKDQDDPSGNSLTYQWTQTDGVSVSLDDPSAARPKFVALRPGYVELTLVVSDGKVFSTPSKTLVQVTTGQNHVPVANAGPDQRLIVGATVQLDGSGSTDPDGDALEHEWEQVWGPPVVLDGTGPNPTFQSLGVGHFRFRLTVWDQEAPSLADEVDIVISRHGVDNQTPVANAGAGRVVAVGEEVTLDGSASIDPDPMDLLTYQWTLVAFPTGNEPTLKGETSSQATLIPGVEGTYTLQLKVSDGDLVSEPSYVSVVATRPAAPGCGCGAGPRESVVWALVVAALLARKRRQVSF